MWFLYAPGSGVWFNTGRTAVFETHAVALQLLCGRQRGPNDATAMALCARAAGRLDSFQFQYDYDVAEDVEIVAVHLAGSLPCGALGDTAAFRSGWAAREPCRCNNSATDGFLNCAANREASIYDESAALRPAASATWSFQGRSCFLVAVLGGATLMRWIRRPAPSPFSENLC